AMAHLADGAYQVLAEMPEAYKTLFIEPVVATVGPGIAPPALKLSASAGAVFTGTIVAPSGAGRAKPTITCMVRLPSSARWDITPDEHGRFTISGIAPNARGSIW